MQPAGPPPDLVVAHGLLVPHWTERGTHEQVPRGAPNGESKDPAGPRDRGPDLGALAHQGSELPGQGLDVPAQGRGYRVPPEIRRGLPSVLPEGGRDGGATGHRGIRRRAPSERRGSGESPCSGGRRGRSPWRGGGWRRRCAKSAAVLGRSPRTKRESRGRRPRRQGYPLRGGRSSQRSPGRGRHSPAG